MSLPIFPNLPTMAWNNSKIPDIDVITKKSGTGKRKSMTTRAYPEWKLTMAFTCLNQEEIEKLAGFILMVGCQLSPFLWKDMEDYKQEKVRIGIGNGANTGFQLIRNWGNYYVEPVRDIVEGTLTVYADNIPVAATLEEDGWIELANPQPGKIITASFEYYWRVAFEEIPDWSLFWYDFYRTKSFSVVTVP